MNHYQCITLNISFLLCWLLANLTIIKSFAEALIAMELFENMLNFPNPPGSDDHKDYSACDQSSDQELPLLSLPVL